MKIKDIFVVVNGINNSLKASWKPTVAYKLSKIKRSLIEESEAFSAAAEKAQQKRREVILEFAENDEKGRPVYTKEGGIKINDMTAYMDKFDKEVKPLSDEVDCIGENDVEVEIGKINISDIPEDCSSEAIDKMYLIIEE